MFVTIDSNVRSLPQSVAKMLGMPATKWCIELNQCFELESTSKYNIFYNTPISMSTDSSHYNIPVDAIHFVYLDFSVNPVTLKLILQNLKNIKNPKNSIIISNGDVCAIGLYVLKVGNCNDDNIAEVISAIIGVHLLKNRPIHEQEIISILCNKTNECKHMSDGGQKKYSIYNVLDSKHANFTEIVNCESANVG